MLRVTLTFLFAIVAVGSAQAQDVREDEAPRLALELDLIQIERDTLNAFTDGKLPSSHFIVLDDIHAFFLHQIIATNGKSTGVRARSKSTFADGKTIEISSGATGANEAGLSAAEKDAWLYRQPFSFEVLPHIVSGDSVALTLKYRINVRGQSVGPATVLDGKAVLVLLDCAKEGIYLAVMITPRVIPAD